MTTVFGIGLLVLVILVAAFVIGTDAGAALGAGILAVAGFPLLVLAGIASLEGWNSRVWDVMGWAGGFGVLIGGDLFALIAVSTPTE